MRNARSTKRFRLNEAQLRRLVRGIIRESYDDYDLPSIPRGDGDHSGLMRALDKDLASWPTYRDYYMQLRDNAENRESGYQTDEEVDAWGDELGYAGWSASELQDLFDEMQDAYDGIYGHGEAY